MTAIREAGSANTAPRTALELREVGVSLGGRRILDGVSFAIAPGEFAGLIGSNGAGKTTLLRIIMGLRSADSGTVHIEDPAPARRGDAGGHGSGGGHSLGWGRGLGWRRGQRRGLRRGRGPAIGYVPQKILIEPDAPLRARDLVSLGLDGANLGPRLPSRQRRRTVDEMLEAVDAKRFADERVGTLSGGEQQRILVAHALIAKPRLLLMDEPLANLDLRAGQEVVELVSRIAKDQGVAVLLSAHDINPLLPAMDKVIYLAAGRAASGITSEVVRSDVLTALYRHPVSVLRVDGRILVVAGSTVTADSADPAGPDPLQASDQSLAPDPPPSAEQSLAPDPPPSPDPSVDSLAVDAR